MPDQAIPPVPALGFGAGPSANAPVGPSAFELSNQRLKREQSTTTGDYLSSIWRQDGLVDGLVANQVGREMTPDPTFNSFTAPDRKAIEEGIWPEFLPELDQAHSAAHQLFIKDRLLQKQKDLLSLDDLGWKGNVGRFALNAVMPDQLLAGMVGGRVAQGVRAFQLAKAGRAAAGIAAAERVAGVAAEQAAAGTGLKAIASGVGFGAVENAAYEKLRQSVNFESDNGQVLEAALMGAAITAPFAIVGARQAARAADAAAKEHEVLKALRDAHEGDVLTPEQVKLIEATYRYHTALQEHADGKLSDEALAHAADEFVGPLHPEVERLHGQELVDELLPSVPHAVPEAPALAAEARVAKAADNQKLREAFDLTGEKPQLEARAAAPAVDETALARVNEDPIQAAQREALTEAPASPVEAPVAPAAPKGTEWVGKAVSWADKEGNELAGTVARVSPSGKLVVDTGAGPKGMKAVHPHELDQFNGEAPTGFLHGSVGSAQIQKVARYFPDARTHMAEVTITRNGKDYKIPTRFDIYAVLNASPSEHVRELAFRLVKDAIQNHNLDAQGWTASEWKKQLQRTVAGQFHVESKAAFKEAVKAAQVPVWRKGEFANEFYSLVSQVTRGDTAVLTSNQAIAPALKRASSAQRQAMAAMLKHMKDAGVKGTENVAADDFYVNRVWHHRQIREAIQKHGEDSVVEVIRGAIQNPKHILDRYKQSPSFKASPISDTEILRMKAKRFLGAVRSLEFSPALQDLMLAGRDMGTLRRELEAMGVKESHIDDLVDFMFEVKEATSDAPDAGRVGNLKFRFGLDEASSVKTAAGDLKLSDLFENDARLLVDSYINSMAGHTGLAKVGIDSQAAWQAELRKVEQEALENPSMDGGRIGKDLALLNEMHKNITGRPMASADFSGPNRFATAFRGYTRSVTLGQLGIAAAFELSKAVAMMGFKSLQQLPSFHSLFVAMRQGYIPDKGLARDIRLITGFGNELASSYVRAAEIEDGFFGQSLTRAERGANKASHAVDILSGNASFTSVTKHLSGMMAVQDMADHAYGRKKLTPKLRERWVGQGINDDDIETVLAGLRKYSDEDAGVVKSIRYEDWQQADPRSYETFQLFLSRQVRDAIQDHDIGETMPFMHSTLGKMFSELKTFFLVAHAKNMLKQMHFRDATALHVWTIGFLGESLAYMTQTAINYPNELDTRLTPEKVATAAFARMSSLGTMSLLWGTGYGLATGEDFFQPGMTANTDNRSFLKTPSLQVAGKLLQTPTTLANAILGTDITTKPEGLNAAQSLPGANLIGVRGAINWWANTLPKSDPSKVRTP